jgi:hypothetical protein
MDGDSKIDLFSSCWVTFSIKLLKNTGSPGNPSLISVNSPYNIISGARPATAVADIDGDAKPDLIQGATPYIYRNILNERGALAGKDTTIVLARISGAWWWADAALHTYSWSSNPAGFSSTIANPIVNPTVTTTYYVSVTNPQGCIAHDTIVVTWRTCACCERRS